MRRVVAALILPVAAALGGCVVVAAAVVAGAVAGTYAYINGEAKQEYDASLTRTWNAALATMKEGGLLDLRGEGPDQWKGTLWGIRSSDNAKVTVKLEAIGEKRTRVSVRFGTFGDEAGSRNFHDRLAKRLR